MSNAQGNLVEIFVFSLKSFFHSPSSNNIYIVYIVTMLPFNKVLLEQFQVLANPQLIVLFIISIKFEPQIMEIY